MAPMFSGLPRPWVRVQRSGSRSAGHMTVFETIDGRHITTKSYVTFSLKPGQNGWHFLGKIPPPLSKASMKRKSNEDFPTQNVVQLPYETDPMDQNEVIDSVHLMGTGGEGQPRVVVLDKDARVLRMDGETGELVGTKETILMPELKDQVDQLSDPDNEVHSADFLTNLLSRDPKAFTGRKCFQHFHEAIPEGVYQGKILSQQFFGEGTEKNSIFHVAFPPTASNPVHLTEYDDEEVKKYVIDCVDGKIPVEYPIEPGHLHVDDFDQYLAHEAASFCRGRIFLQALQQQLCGLFHLFCRCVDVICLHCIVRSGHDRRPQKKHPDAHVDPYDHNLEETATIQAIIGGLEPESNPSEYGDTCARHCHCL